MPTYETRRERSRSQRRCIGFTETLEVRREKRANKNAPQPWIVQKFAVGLVVGLVGYTIYVYVVRLCVPMIRREAGSVGGRTMGIAFLAVFSFLFLMFSWTYLKVVFTPPGYARDYVSKSLPSESIPQPQPAYHPDSLNSNESIAGVPYQSTSPSRSRSRPSIDTPRISPQSRSPPHSRRNTQDTSKGSGQARPSQRARGGETRSLDADSASRDAAKPNAGLRQLPAAHIAQRGNGAGSSLPTPLYSRRPPTNAILSPEYRYCSRDGLVKPMRAHHCRACGTCVLKYDHHCPWIGQCVGAFNHKFFVNFLQWSTVFTAFVFATLIPINVQASASSLINASIDPQQIVIIALSGIFTLFTLALFISHVHLILLNASTVEHLDMQRMRERERSMLSRLNTCTPLCSPSSRQLPEAYGLPPDDMRSPLRVVIWRRRIVKNWDAEWGEIGTEGNIWWLGSRRANWEATMGKAKLGWILPIGRSIGDGLTYPTNPRFDRDGRWRRRAEWPDGLR